MLTVTGETRHIVEERLRKLTELYLVVKEVILYFEEVNPDQKADLQPINELRNAFDHLMRVSAVSLEITEQEDPQKYLLTHIDKAFGHVYRAGYDTVDFLSLTLKAQIADELSGFSVNAIKTALPEYYSTIKPEIEKINEDISKYRAEKDVAQADADHLIDYIKTVRTLGYHRDLVSRALPSIVEIDEREKRFRRQASLNDWIKRIIIGILLIVAGYLLKPHLDKLFKNSPTISTQSNPSQLGNKK